MPKNMNFNFYSLVVIIVVITESKERRTLNNLGLQIMKSNSLVIVIYCIDHVDDNLPNNHRKCHQIQDSISRTSTSFFALIQGKKNWQNQQFLEVHR